MSRAARHGRSSSMCASGSVTTGGRPCRSCSALVAVAVMLVRRPSVCSPVTSWTPAGPGTAADAAALAGVEGGRAASVRLAAAHDGDRHGVATAGSSRSPSPCGSVRRRRRPAPSAARWPRRVRPRGRGRAPPFAQDPLPMLGRRESEQARRRHRRTRRRRRVDGATSATDAPGSNGSHGDQRQRPGPPAALDRRAGRPAPKPAPPQAPFDDGHRSRDAHRPSAAARPSAARRRARSPAAP